MSVDRYNSNNSINTLYIRNLNEKVSSAKLKSTLASTFKKNGFMVLDIVAFQNVKLRGQSFVTLPSHKDCLRAMEKINTSLVLGRPMVMHLAKVNSDTGIKEIMKRSHPKDYVKMFDDYIDAKRPSRLSNRKIEKSKSGRKRSLDDNQSEGAKVKRVKGMKKVETTVPNKILLLTGLSDDVTEKVLYENFDTFKGFLNLTYVGVRHLALVEFRSEDESARCLKDLSTKVSIYGANSQLQFAKK
ncbi:DEKNAAC100152 [Brettanomyces naardenensis]|uniref:DEKNAAC100152 n=1 Tax=Brettanomyces naardenensis TaxID=13370 RepID=A0A448YFV7_BRENA|nr:DEKNAAC100152 [Brettanomyces naardenensis]